MENIRDKFSKIYDKYIEKIYRFVFVKVSSQEIAEDLTSETFSRTWTTFKDKSEEIENIQAFLYATAKNLVVDHYRQKGKISIVSLENSKIIDPKQDLEEASKNKSDLKIVKQAITELKPDYQNVLIWHYLNDLSISEIAEIIGRTDNATRVLLSRATKSLKKTLEGKTEQV